MRITALQEHALVDGTTLALRYGHRQSVDLDLFGNEVFDHDGITAGLRGEFGAEFRYEPALTEKFGIFCYVEGVKVDIVRYPHARIADVVMVNGIRMYADEDIAAMKIQAVMGHGRKKDFWDLLELLHVHGLQWIMDKHSEKYPNQMLAISIPNALTYFTDAEDSEEPVSLKGQTWEGIKRSIQQTVNEYLK